VATTITQRGVGGGGNGAAASIGIAAPQRVTAKKEGRAGLPLQACPWKAVKKFPHLPLRKKAGRR